MDGEYDKELRGFGLRLRETSAELQPLLVHVFAEQHHVPLLLHGEVFVVATEPLQLHEGDLPPQNAYLL